MWREYHPQFFLDFRNNYPRRALTLSRQHLPTVSYEGFSQLANGRITDFPIVDATMLRLPQTMTRPRFDWRNSISLVMIVEEHLDFLKRKRVSD